MSLTIVQEDYSLDQDAAPAAPLPSFEGETVHGLRAKLTSTTNLELGEDSHRLDETTRMLVTGRVTRVDHVVDERSGQLMRVETFKVVEAVEVPWEALADYLGDE